MKRGGKESITLGLTPPRGRLRQIKSEISVAPNVLRVLARFLLPELRGEAKLYAKRGAKRWPRWVLMQLFVPKHTSS